MGDAEKKNHSVLLLTRKFEPTHSAPGDDDDGEEEDESPRKEQQRQQRQQHSKLTKSILKLTKKKDKRKQNSEQRTEFASKVSEFTFKSGAEASVKVDIRDLSRTLASKGGGDKSGGKKGEDVGRKDADTDKDKDKDDEETQPAKTDKKGSVVHREVRNLKARQPTRAPLVKHKEEKLLRQVGYNVAVEEVKKWKGVVKRNREAETASFPLEQPSFNVSSTQELVQRFKPRTPLEVEVAKLLNGSESVLGPDRVLTVREERALKAMDLDEARRKRAELQKMRSLRSYAQVRAKRQGKIKSKRYHRRLRKAKEGENAKIYEELEKSHPERFREMLEKMERKRVEERMNQRHKNNSKWVKSMMKLGKKDSEARTALNEALETSRKLTEKRQAPQSDEEEEEEEGEEGEKEKDKEMIDDLERNGISDIANNPWLSSSNAAGKKGGGGGGRGEVGKEKGSEEKEEKEGETISSMYPKLEEIRNLVESSDDDEEEEEEEEEDEDDSDDDDDDDKPDAEDLPTIRDDDDDDDDRTVEKGDRIISKLDKEDARRGNNNNSKKPNASSSSSSSAVREEVDPTKILLRAPEVVASSQLPTLASYDNDVDGGDDDDGNDEAARRRLTIEEAFADDDVVAEFAAAKSAVVERQTPKPVCTALPGWGGDWVGGTLDGISERRKRKFTEKLTAEQRKPRKDKDNPRVIINEKRRRDNNNKLAKHLVSEIPTRDFDSVQEFEKSIRAPVGRTWNAEAAYQKIIVPNVTTKMGTVINPIDKEKTFVRKEEAAYSGEEEEEEEDGVAAAKKRRRRKGGRKDGKMPSLKKSDMMNKTNGKKT